MPHALRLLLARVSWRGCWGLLALLVCTDAFAVCSGGSPTWMAANATQAEVQACITAVDSSGSTGDIIQVPAGSATWTSPIALSATVGVHLQGAGEAQTLITCTGICLTAHTTVDFRISGFRFTYLGTTTQTLLAVGLNDDPTGHTFRVDHNGFHAPNAWGILDVWGGGATCNSATHASGVYDHNLWTNTSLHVGGTNCSLTDGTAQHALWTQSPPFGTWPGVLYVEDNLFTCTGSPPAINILDGNYGARMVFRYNTITNTGTATCYVEVHGVQGPNRAVQMWEVYRNTLTSALHGFFGLGFFRGGSGFVWGNRLATGTQALKLNDQRSNTGCVADGVCTVAGPCDGTSTWDENTAGQNGYACRDQIGRSRDTTPWLPGQAYTMPLTPAYFWDNVAGASTLYGPVLHDGAAGTSYMALHIQENRDWYTQGASFDGTTGVGVGTLAARPGTCTVGVGYWATDQGTWNLSGSGTQGQLFTCTTPDTWALAYTPYTYPHPLVGVEVVPPPPLPAVTVGPTVPLNANLVVVGHLNFCADAGTSDAYACTLDYPLAAYHVGTRYTFRANTANAGAASLNVNGLGAVLIKKRMGASLADLGTGDIGAGHIVEVIYDGTQMQVLSHLSQ